MQLILFNQWKKIIRYGFGEVPLLMFSLKIKKKATND